MQQSAYHIHNPKCRSIAQRDPEGLDKTLAFTIGSIRNGTWNLPSLMDEYKEVRWKAKELSWGNKKKAGAYIEENLYDLFDSMHTILRSRKDEGVKLLDLFSTIPGIDLAKAGFVAQLSAGKVGCMDSHNMKRYNLDPKDFKTTGLKRDSPARWKKIRLYESTTKRSGGCRKLWNTWCDGLAELRPEKFNSGFQVSKLHVDCLAN